MLPNNRRYLSTFVLSLISVITFADNRLTGTIIGTTLSVDYTNTSAPSTTLNTRENAFDGDLTTFFASWDRSFSWVGLDLGTPHVITRVAWSPRNDGQGPKRERGNDLNVLSSGVYIIRQGKTARKIIIQ